MRKPLVTVACLAASIGSASAGQFVGELKFVDESCKSKQKCVLAGEFGYIDSTGGGWEARQGDKTDGASIPPAVRDWIGRPFDDDLIRAAVIHDHYCDRKVNTWSDTHWVFYDALLTSGVERRRARLMYAAVLLGGPFWIGVYRGTNCTIGRNCVMSFDTKLPALDGATVIQERGVTYLYRPDRYADPEYQAELEKLEGNVDRISGIDDRGEIEALVKVLRPYDHFLTGPDSIVLAPNNRAAQ
ncbi:MAG: DUF1353 domain-containing protein [Hyphomicrobiaceae bacterium]